MQRPRSLYIYISVSIRIGVRVLSYWTVYRARDSRCIESRSRRLTVVDNARIDAAAVKSSCAHSCVWCATLWPLVCCWTEFPAAASAQSAATLAAADGLSYLGATNWYALRYIYIYIYRLMYEDKQQCIYGTLYINSGMYKNAFMYMQEFTEIFADVMRIG